MPSSKTLLHIGLIVILGLVIFIPRLGTLSFRGEEPRRVVSAFEIQQSGNWSVPTIQKQLFLSRPPLQNWVIAATAMVRGSYDHLTGRLPTVVCAILTALLIYFYCSALLPRSTGLLAALFFLCMPQVLQLGLTAETELMFTFFLSASFLLWHYGALKKWPSSIQWGVAYFFLALATLTKGINQAPLYFAAIIGMHLLYQRKLKQLFSLGHLFGLLIGCLIVGAWQWEFAKQVGTKVAWLMHAGDVGLRFKEQGISQYIQHALVFPFELLAVMLPWSLFLSAYVSRSFWTQSLSQRAKPIAVFCLSAIAITLISVWYPPGARTRYYMPLFPCFAILAAIAANAIWDTLLEKKDLKVWWARLVAIFMPFWMITIPLLGFIVFVHAIVGTKLIEPPEPFLNALIYLIGTMLVGLSIWGLKRSKHQQAFTFSVLAYALFASLTINFVYTDSRLQKLNNMEQQLAEALKHLPKGVDLVSVSTGVPFEFLYYYMLKTGKTIPIISESALLAMEKPTYFCSNLSSMPKLDESSQSWQPLFTLEAGRYKASYKNSSSSQIMIARLE